MLAAAAARRALASSCAPALRRVPLPNPSIATRLVSGHARPARASYSLAPLRTLSSALTAPRSAFTPLQARLFSTSRPLLASGSSGDSAPKQSRFWPRTRTFLRFTVYLCGSTIVGVAVLTSAIFVHDAFTYNERHVDGVPVSPLALHPERGGPKNLPVVHKLLSDIEDPENAALATKPHLVIVGGGWGAVGVLQNLRPGDYHVTVVSPETYTTFTPLLPSAAVGTVQIRSLVEPLRKIVARLRGHFLNAKAVDLVMSERLLEVETEGVNGPQRLYLPYDKLVIAVGSTSATHGVNGLEHCFQLKTTRDARLIRQRIIDNFEQASLPTTSPEERKRLLSFVVCGGGPTGVETAAEIYDLCQEDIMKYYPKICNGEVSIHVIQSREHILNTYSEAISRYAERKFLHDDIDLITSARVAEVHEDRVEYTKKGLDGKTERHAIPTNFVLWSTGIAMNPFAAQVTKYLPNQVHKKAIEVDAHLRVKGSPPGEVYAIGDASTIETSIVNHLLDLVDESDRNKDGKIDFDEWEIMVARIKQRIPMAETQLEKVRELFELYDSDADNSLSLNELAVLLKEIGSKITALPATAQVASQEGKYLGHKLHKLARQRETLAANELTGPGEDEAVAPPFRYRHLGSLAYIGNAAVFDLGKYSFMGGLAAMYAWRSVYWSEQVSMRTRALLMIDWIVRGVWGRDLSRL
ncbi:nucleotide-binding domain-containing protein [Obba rivulosa]|uniref:Nucleotide-binding domain-containing protein n=1 Tax=Obba rivulosa TaxID=1052685 RepID=A0A8E2DKE7_9APHY|nr:nucleotide-binding domain-containing protein [Obba rivulosa]